MANHHKVNEISRRLRWLHIHPENDALATLRVFALDPKLLFYRHVSNLGGRGLTKNNLADHSKLYPEYPVLLQPELRDARRIASLGAQGFGWK
jgi:hypothetical protein